MTDTPRFRLFAGPNGSGKSTVIDELRKTKIAGRPLDFGVYVNADEIALHLRDGRGVRFDDYRVKATYRSLRNFARRSGLLRNGFPESTLREYVHVGQNVLVLKKDVLVSVRATSSSLAIKTKGVVSYIAQLVAQYLCDRLLRAHKKFSLETVFSHESKIQLMQRAKRAGYKVYFYFIATEDPAINVQRVQLRAEQGGHDVPEERVRSRYGKCMANLYRGIELSDRAYCWDNSGAGVQFFFDRHRFGPSETMSFAQKAPRWFKKFYVDKVPEQSDD